MALKEWPLSVFRGRSSMLRHALTPRNRSPERCREVARAVRGLRDADEALEVLQARELLPFDDGLPPLALRHAPRLSAPRALAAAACDYAGLHDAVLLALEAHRLARADWHVEEVRVMVAPRAWVEPLIEGGYDDGDVDPVRPIRRYPGVDGMRNSDGVDWLSRHVMAKRGFYAGTLKDPSDAAVRDIVRLGYVALFRPYGPPLPGTTREPAGFITVLVGADGVPR